MSWHRLPTDPPVDQKLVLVVFANAVKDILSWNGETWSDQHDDTVDGEAPLWWHELPPPPPPPPMPEPEPRPPAVHVLKGGHPLCRFDLSPPAAWPEGHCWISFEDEEQLPRADCPECVRLQGFPECPTCKTGRRSSDPARVEYASGNRKVMFACRGCGKPTEWRTTGPVPTSFEVRA